MLESVFDNSGGPACIAASGLLAAVGYCKLRADAGGNAGAFFEGYFAALSYARKDDAARA